MKRPDAIRSIALAAMLLVGAGCKGHRRESIKDPGYAAPMAGAPAARIVTNPPAVMPPPAVETKPPAEAPAPPAEAPQVGVVDESPPPPQVEIVRDSPGPEYAWIPGFWDWRGHWVWVSGRWMLRPNPQAMWVPGRWMRKSGGWMWVRGYWR